MSLSRKTILVVDDEPDLCEIVRRVLSRDGATVLMAAGLREGARLVATHEGDIDLLITDVRMPGGSGVELGAQIRRERPATAVLFMSGMLGSHESVEGLGAGATVLAKPFTAQQLTAAVVAALPAPTAS